MSPDEGKEEMEEAQADIRKKEEEVNIMIVVFKLNIIKIIIIYNLS
jgi:hypothetical protein